MLDLPSDLQARILSLVSFIDRVNAERVCRVWRSLLADPQVLADLIPAPPKTLMTGAGAAKFWQWCRQLLSILEGCNRMRAISPTRWFAGSGWAAVGHCICLRDEPVTEPIARLCCSPKISAGSSGS